MKKYYILGALVCSFLFLFFLVNCSSSSVKSSVLECNLNTMIEGSNATIKHVINSENDIAVSDNLSVKAYMTEVSDINAYQNTLTGNLECGGLNIFDDYVSYECYYYLKNNSYYKEIENDDGKVLIEKMKEKLEKEEYICEYK